MSIKMQYNKGLLIAAPSSGSGKTVITLGLLRALQDAGVEICGAKAGPDYIDPAFHMHACGKPSVNLDPWAMTADRLTALAVQQSGSHLLVEGMMGLFDGAVDGSGSAADLAMMLGIPILLVVDAAKQSHSIAALVRGFRDHDPRVQLAGVILNRVGSPRHSSMLRSALERIDVSVLGCVPRDLALALPERHLGLVQAGEIAERDVFIEQAAKVVGEACDLDGIKALFTPMIKPSTQGADILPPLGQRIAIARDEAFSFVYPHWLNDWRASGAELSFFSPLADEKPEKSADAIFLPGGYPELHAGKIAAAGQFRDGLHQARDRDTLIYGECGGYMVLGEGLVDADGVSHRMAGLLQLETSFAERKLHLGYRRLSISDFLLGKELSAHEFHYTSAIREEGEPLFEAKDALGADLGKVGLRHGSVMGSYMHVIDQVAS